MQTIREAVFVVLLEDRIKQVRKDGFTPDFASAADVANTRTSTVINALVKNGWTI